MRQRKIAIVGSGISGMSAAWHLHQHSDITVFEKADYIGGHSNTVDIEVEGKRLPVDTGFIVFNPVNYPNLTALFDLLDVPSAHTDMSFSVSMGGGDFEYSGGDNAGMLAQRANIFRPRFWRMVSGILKFYGKAEDYENLPDDFTLGALLAEEGYSRSFIEDHLAPMGAAIWSSDSVDILEYPARSFIKFFRNHGLVQLKDRPQWRTVVGGSREYVKKLTQGFSNKIHTKSLVSSVRRESAGCEVFFANGQMREFDEVVFACHSDQALALLSDPSQQETQCLSAMRYSQNQAVLHTDKSWLPKREAAWASWNYIEPTSAYHGRRPAITYWMNRLQHLPVATPVMVTLNPFKEIEESQILGRYDYEHPIFDAASHEARSQLMSLQGTNRIWFCGAYLGDGFHEDGIQAGLAVAEMISQVERPWYRAKQNARIGLPDQIVLPMAAQ
ncbi:MAG: FAD-dependent oxidoreductase [Kordiimonadaceae bacterium]|nr:FAD-dependent oxidoreductase [Kordiimonadaceae bacterium]MBO6570477.1 FAD-dependent oxidoreductase [Kordiimonadaceae bacterium]MBO6966404.1 FAD-dependent oxidoreductase [Kordiimonadaceae bacterium]